MGFRFFAVSRRWLLIIFISCMAVAAGCFAAWQLSSIASADAAVQFSTPVDDAAYLLDCSHNAVSEPVTFSVLCGSGTYALDNLRWETWGADTAQATGTYFEKDCVPNCAQGMLQGYPVAVEADKIQRAGASARYKRLTLTFDGARPQWLQDEMSVSYDVSNLDPQEIRSLETK